MVLLPLQMNMLLESGAPPPAATTDWLSLRALDVVFSAPAVQSGYLNIAGGITSSSSVGYMLDYDYRCVGMWILRDTGPVTNETFHITQNGTDVVSLTISTGETVKRLVSSVDFDQDDVVGCRLDAGSTEKITTVHARFRRRV